MRYILLFVVVSLSSFAHSDEEEVAASALQPANGVEWCERRIQVVDERGDPIEGATVRPWALRAGNGHGTWPDVIGAPRETVTDTTGHTTVIYPKEIMRRRSEPVSSVSMIVKHPEFVARNIHVSVPADVIFKQELKPGIRLRVAGVEPGSKQPLDHCYLMIENPDVGEQEFVREPSGWLQSNAINEDRRWFRIIHAAPGKPPRFSQLLAWTPDDATTRERLVEVRPGTRIEGKISENVPRPIERGHVVACCGSPKHSDDEKVLNWRPIHWAETVPIKPDGSFVFESLPSGYLVQFYAFANDYISAQPTEEAYAICCKWFGEDPRRHDIFRYGQVLRLTGSKSELTIEMELGGEVQFKCVDPEGRPLSGVFVACSPNQYMVGFGSTIFCGKRSSLSALLSPAREDWREFDLYRTYSGADGIATIRNLPAGQHSFVGGSRLWTIDETRAEVDPEMPTEMKLEFHRRP